MKFMSILLLGLTLALVVGCDAEDEIPQDGRYFNPLSCVDKSAGECDVDWIISFARDNYPDTVQIVINDKVVVDDCDSQSYWSKNQTSRYNEYTIHDSVRFDCTKTFKMRVFDRKNCLDTKVEHTFVNEQRCMNKVVGGQKQIWVEKN